VAATEAAATHVAAASTAHVAAASAAALSERRPRAHGQRASEDERLDE
jgi:hypothetical protein